MLEKKEAKLPAGFKTKLGDVYRYLKEYISLPADFLYDFFVYAGKSGTFRTARTQKTLQAYIIRLYHGIEVGLSYPDPKPGFGIKTVKRLLKALEKCEKKFGIDYYAKIALNVLYKYVEFNKQLGLEFLELNDRLKRLESKVPESLKDDKRGGYETLDRKDIFDPVKTDFESVIRTRHSFRQYTSEKVETELLEKAVKLAMRSPSACNRQQARVFVLENKKVRERVLRIQNNQRGWRDQPDRILLVTSSVEYYRQSRERYAAYIDGGLFAMTLVWALHSLGIGTCCLNLNLDKQGIKKLKKAAGLSQSDVPIMLITAGKLPEKNNIAVSTRRDVNEVLTII
ncbi:nitroreductase family protein [candidate division KSB1 bacterium]|nr:nitroreductase family protein [candidate division KSB1 bacterium]